jgi:hypothetical protein
MGIEQAYADKDVLPGYAKQLEILAQRSLSLLWEQDDLGNQPSF